MQHTFHEGVLHRAFPSVHIFFVLNNNRKKEPILYTYHFCKPVATRTGLCTAGGFYRKYGGRKTTVLQILRGMNSGKTYAC